MRRDDDDVRERGHLVGLGIGDSQSVDGRDQPIELVDRGRRIAGVDAHVGAERRVGGLLVRPADGHGGVIVGACGRVLAQERVRVSRLHEQHGIAGFELVAPQVFVACFLEVALRPIGIADEEVRIGLIRRQRLRLLHVRERLRKVVRLTEDVVVPNGGVRHVQLGRELQGLRDRGTPVRVLVQANLGSGERQPGARTVRILRHELLPEGELPRQVVVEPFARHLDLEPFGLRGPRGVLLGERQVGLELLERVGRIRDVQISEREVWIRGDGLLEMRIRVDEAGQIELPLAPQEVVPGRPRGRGDRVLDHRTGDGIERGP